MLPVSLLHVCNHIYIKLIDCIVAPAKITVQPINKTITVLEDVKFTCIAEGFDVTYEWRHNGTTLNANTSQSGLTITQVVPSDAGHYVCIASTGGGKDVSQSATLTINGERSCVTSLNSY